MKEGYNISGGVCDSEGRIAAVGTGYTDIDIIDLMSGETQRHLQGWGNPLMIDHQFLLGWRFESQPNTIRVFRLDLSLLDSTAKWSDPINLPGGVDLHTIDDDDFSVSFRREINRYVFTWHTTPPPSGGTALAPEWQSERGSGSSSAAIELELETLATLNRSEGGLPQPHMEELRKGEQLTRDHGGQVYRQAEQLRNAPWTVEGGKRFLKAEDNAAGTSKTLSIADADNPHSTLTNSLKADASDIEIPELSLDSKHLAIAQTIDGRKYQVIYETVTGSMVAKFPFDTTLQSFRVIRTKLFFLDRKIDDLGGEKKIAETIMCIDLSSGKILWRHSLTEKTITNQFHLPQ